MDLLKFKREPKTESEWSFDVELIEKISEATRKTEYFVGMEEVESVLLVLCNRKTVPDTGSKCNKHSVKASFSNKYGFLYWCENDTTADDGRCKWIEASTLDEACAKFIKKAPKTLRQVDYEVQLGNKYIDISERADFKNWL
jgi:hypothetical protein